MVCGIYLITTVPVNPGSLFFATHWSPFCPIFLRSQRWKHIILFFIVHLCRSFSQIVLRGIFITSVKL